MFRHRELAEAVDKILASDEPYCCELEWPGIERRTSNPEPAGDLLELAGIRIDKSGHQVRLDGKMVDLTPTEFSLLETLLKQPGRALTRADLLDSAMGNNIVLDRTIDVHIKSLRRKLGPKGECVKTVRGVGYRFHGQ